MLLLVYSQKNTPRFTYVFKHLFSRILGIDVLFASEIEEFVAHNGPKISYGKQPLGNELFFQEHGLLSETGIEAIDIQVRSWEDMPIFFATSEKSAMPFDIFAASFYLLSRYEEYLPHVKDSKGRYPASESLAYQNNFLETPIIDVWTYKLKSLLQVTFPNLYFPPRKAKVHNVLSVLRPFAFKQKGFFRSLLAYLEDLAKFNFKRIGQRTQVLVGARKDPFDTFTWIVNIAKRSKSQLTAFFLLGENEAYQDSLNTHRTAFKLLVKYLGDYKEVGLLYSASSLLRYTTLQSEIKRMEEITKRKIAHAKQSYYVVNLPDNYRNLIELEIQRDFTMTYHDTVGFRAGTCTPFLFYDLDFEIKTPLLLQPIAVTSTAIHDVAVSDAEDTVLNLLKSVQLVKGTFSMVFSNEDFTSEDKNVLWRKLFSETLHEYE